MLYREIMAVCSEIHTKPINSFNVWVKYGLLLFIIYNKPYTSAVPFHWPS